MKVFLTENETRLDQEVKDILRIDTDPQLVIVYLEELLKEKTIEDARHWAQASIDRLTKLSEAGHRIWNAYVYGNTKEPE